MKNLLDATEIATLFLDRNLKVRRFTSQATHLFKLIPGDVGRPITDLSSDLLQTDLAADVEEVLRTVVFRERQVSTADGHWFTVRVMPYRTMENVIDGVVITMVNITALKGLETALRRSRDRFGALL
jgi:two-component system CheB/CheR fusion protein